MAKLLSSVKQLWKTKPLLVNCVTYGALYGGAELTQQCLIRKAFVSTLQWRNQTNIDLYALVTTFLLFCCKQSLYVWSSTSSGDIVSSLNMLQKPIAVFLTSVTQSGLGINVGSIHFL